MGGAGGARPRTYFAWLGTLCLSRRLLGAPPHCPLFACQRRERKRSLPRSAMSKAIRHRDEQSRNTETRKRQFAPTTRTKSVFLWGATPVSLGKTKEMGWHLGRRDFRPCIPCLRAGRRQLDHWPRRALTSSKRLSIRRWASSLRAPKLSPRARVASSG